MLSYSAVRQSAIQEARRLLTQKPIYLDTETTGLDNRAEIVEIAILDDDGNTLLDSLVKPRYPIPADASRIHAITNTVVADAPTWGDLWPQISLILNERVVGIYNAEFDLKMLAQSQQFARLPWAREELRSFCIMQIYARYYGERGYGSFRWQSLEKAGRQCQLNLPNNHRAADDARLARAVLHHVAGGE